ncbi:hypothetical protein [Streptomyces sp. NPDC052207]|uniref:hypothetical protein n=1 Tax=Streptomyces sp. NPDC052207 TaxID=3155418 RepID=UPI003425B729
MDDEAITIKLTRDQAFVLSHWLYQVMFQSDDLEGIVRDRAVWSPIYAISGTLEAAKERLRANLYGETNEPTEPNEDAVTAPQAHQIEGGTAGSNGESEQGR